MKNILVRNWKKMWMSLAVVLPTVVTILLLGADAALDSGIIPVEYLPLVIFISGFIGRVISQPNLDTSLNRRKR